MANPFVHVELQTHDAVAAKDFYGRLFGWSLTDEPMPSGHGTYTMIGVGDGTGGGIYSNPDAQAPACWLAYVGVDDIVAATARARELGATITVDCVKVGDFGWMSVFVDPAGATLALWQSHGSEA